MRHELKTDPRTFDTVWKGTKLYEIRKDDRHRDDTPAPCIGYKVDDELLLRETEFSGEQMRGGRMLGYTGREVVCVVTHKLTGFADGRPEYGIMPGWCILGIRRVELINKKGPYGGAHYSPKQPNDFANVQTSTSAYDVKAGVSSELLGTVVGTNVKTHDPLFTPILIEPGQVWIDSIGAEIVINSTTDDYKVHTSAGTYARGLIEKCWKLKEPIASEGSQFIDTKIADMPKRFESNKTATALAVAWDAEGAPYCFAHGRNTHVMDCRTCEVSIHARCSMETERRKKDVPVAVERRIDAKQMSNKSGGHVSYYSVDVDNPSKGGAPYRAEAIDVIASLDMTFAEGEAFKAVWRCAADRCGAHKDGNDTRRDAEKVAYYGEQMTAREKKRHG